MYQHKNGITLRKIERTDLSLLLSIKSESWWGIHHTLISNSDDQNRWFDSLGVNNLCMMAHMESHTSEPVGFGIYTNIDWVGHVLHLSGSIRKEFRRPDLVKAAFGAGLDFAFEILNMCRVEAEVLEYNSPAQRLEIDYLGFKIEGRKRKSVYKSGRYYDSYVLGILREEWEQDERVKAYGGSCNQVFSHQLAQKIIDRSSREDQLVV